jgi:glycerol-3-phosphate acyltransferase PlsY
LALPFFLRTPDLGFFVAGLSVIIGHNWSVFLRFKGGKGVAVSASVITLLYPCVGIASLVLLVLVVWRSKYVSLGSILMAMFWLLGILLLRFPAEDIGFTSMLTLLILVQHRGNIQRLLKGEERKISFTKK